MKTLIEYTKLKKINFVLLIFTKKSNRKKLYYIYFLNQKFI